MQTQTLRIVVALLVTVVIMLFFYTNREKDMYSKSAEPAVAQIMTEISGWEKNVLLRHLAPEAKQTFTDEQLKDWLNLYREFGRFRSIKEINFSRVASAFGLFGDKKINYFGVAHFSTGEINFNITLIERGGYFLVYNLALTKVT